MILSYKFRIKDATLAKYLSRYAYSSNQVWNYCCQIQKKAESNWKAGQHRKWPRAFDLIRLCTGSAADLGIHSDTVQTICRRFVASRDANRRCPRFRASGGAKCALGWVPFIPRAISIKGDAAIYLKRSFRFWKSREIDGEIKAGAFIQDARGRWYVVLQCEVADNLPTGNGKIGIDLGLKAIATTSDGIAIPALRHYRKYEAALATAQRANNKSRVKAIHAKISNARRHHLHEWSTRIARENSLIVVGNVSASNLAKTKMAKSIMDAGWGMLKAQLAYKARRHNAAFIEVDERWSSATCSSCSARSGPKGIAGLRIRSWTCSDCGRVHDRDHNAALNILRFGLERQAPAVEIPAL